MPFHIPPYHIKFSVTAQQLGQVIPWGITYMGVPDVQKMDGAQGEGILVCILDSGIDPGNPDFAGAIKHSKDFTGSGGVLPKKEFHGIHVAGTVGGRNKGQAAVGVATKCDLAIGRVLSDEGMGEDEWIVAGIEWAIGLKADIISMSLGSSDTSKGIMYDALRKAIAKGILVFAAAGNEGPALGSVGAPGAWNDVCEAVAAISQKEKITSFSSRGSEVDIAAPGEHILSTWINNRFAYLDGTSMATPHISGAAACILSYRKKHGLPGFSSQQAFRAALVATAKPLDPTFTDLPSVEWGYGAINLKAMLDYGVITTPTKQLHIPIPTPFLGYSWELLGTPLATGALDMSAELKGLFDRIGNRPPADPNQPRPFIDAIKKLLGDGATQFGPILLQLAMQWLSGLKLPAGAESTSKAANFKELVEYLDKQPKAANWKDLVPEDILAMAQALFDRAMERMGPVAIDWVVDELESIYGKPAEAAQG